jgi:ankyrin repeat protein
MFKAAREGHQEMLRLLLSAGVEVNVLNPNTPLHAAAAAAGQREMVRLLLAAGAIVDAASNSGFTPLYAAACPTPTFYPDSRSGDLELVQLLLAAGANVDPVYQGRTPLFVAALRADQAMMRLLLSHGANPQFRDTWAHDTPQGSWFLVPSRLVKL